ncbi:MAG TPA: NAD(P)H-dependent glycerol-3-phosphate dehydrogenase [Acidimicrobiia bacterium]|nr:NAD(P)H-dependent glycerol-3-phosphate dehydrogenase [Acidimicrobiia bacterium]
MSIAVIGAGSWGTTLAILASTNTDVVLYTRDKNRASEMQQKRRNEKYLKNVELPHNIMITANQDDVTRADHVIFAVPSIGFRDAVKQFSFLDPQVPYVSVTKGLEQVSSMRMSQVIQDADPRKKSEAIAVLGGPNLAHEIANSMPAATLVASASLELAENVQSILMTNLFRVYVSQDVIGCEIGGVAKNVVAIAVGIGDGLEFGDNAKAAVMTRALAEITRLGVSQGGISSTFSGLAGVGDLMATCSSPLSRNRTVGYLLGQGKTLEEIQQTTHEIAEGVFSAAALNEIALKAKIEMPIVSAVTKVIETGRVSKRDVETLMTRPASTEF